jgi:transposase InsO family protein
LLVLRVLLRLAVAVDDCRRWLPRRVRRWHGSVRRIYRPRLLQGADLTLVWVLGFIPIWVLGIVDYHGSRIISRERMRWWPTGPQVAAAFQRAFGAEGRPERVLTDRGPGFRAAVVQDVFARAGVRHVLTRPAHPWTNGRVERLFATYKSTLRSVVWLIGTVGQADRFTADFVRWYNTSRPHGAWDGRTPDEVFFGRPKHIPERRRVVSYFDGRMAWYDFSGNAGPPAPSQ